MLPELIPTISVLHSCIVIGPHSMWSRECWANFLRYLVPDVPWVSETSTASWWLVLLGSPHLWLHGRSFHVVLLSSGCSGYSMSPTPLWVTTRLSPHPAISLYLCFAPAPLCAQQPPAPLHLVLACSHITLTLPQGSNPVPGSSWLNNSLFHATALFKWLEGLLLLCSWRLHLQVSCLFRFLTAGPALPQSLLLPHRLCSNMYSVAAVSASNSLLPCWALWCSPSLLTWVPRMPPDGTPRRIPFLGPSLLKSFHPFSLLGERIWVCSLGSCWSMILGDRGRGVVICHNILGWDFQRS